jgi:hypothetical protein
VAAGLLRDFFLAFPPPSFARSIGCSFLRQFAVPFNEWPPRGNDGNSVETEEEDSIVIDSEFEGSSTDLKNGKGSSKKLH